MLPTRVPDARPATSTPQMRERDEKDQPRFIVCGSARDGESTLLGRLSSDAQRLEQATRNLATSASHADVAVILVDARKGVTIQTRRRSRVISLMGVRRVILAVNKMDLIDYDQSAFLAIAEEYRAAVFELGFDAVEAVPVSALTGENVLGSQGGTPWYDGPTLRDLLFANAPGAGTDGRFRLPVQEVNGREVGGALASGTVERGMRVVAGLSGKVSTVERILGPSGELEGAVSGQAVTLVLANEIGIGLGDMIADAEHPPGVADQFAVHLIWMDAQPMLPERDYSIRLASAAGIAQITDLTHRIDVDTGGHLAAKTLEANEIGYCKISLDRAVPFDPHSENRRTGSFVLMDRAGEAAVGAGVIDFALRRASNIAWQEMQVDKAARSRITGQKPCVLWLTGLSGAGKSTIADRLEQELQALGRYTYLLDGDNVRRGLNRDLGFTDRDRVENIRRIAEVAKLMVDCRTHRDRFLHFAVPVRAPDGPRPGRSGRVRRNPRRCAA